MTRTEIINYLITKFDYKTYLEIGVRRLEDNFNKIQIENKIGVEPNLIEDDRIFHGTSDDFFETNKEQFDIIFIDGLHIKDQVIKDIHNSLNCLNENGTIVVHDCNPLYEKFQLETNKDGGTWNGTTWKAFVQYRLLSDNISMFTIDEDYGCGIIRKGKQKPLEFTPEIFNFDYLHKNRKEMLNLVSFNEFKEMI